MNRILIVEDDQTIAYLIDEHLKKWNYTTHRVQNFLSVLDDFIAFQPHLILLDISLPFYNGFHWCQEIRKISKVHVIFVSSATDNMNIVMAMNMGGDDFITKPFDLAVLLAKINALLRRTYSFSKNSSIIQDGELILNLSDTTLLYNDTKVILTKNEFRIIQVLMQNKGSVVSRDEIIRFLWDSESFIDDNTLTVNVTRLRQKLEEHGIHNYIVTKKGLGYLVL